MNDNASVERLLAIPEVAEIFQVSTKTVRRAITAGELRAHRVGRQWRIAPREVLRYLKDGVL
jgi:excisionase family DNA binding protein